MNARTAAALIGLAALVALPLVTPTYFLHLVIQVLLFGFIYTAWSIMGRFGFVSLGHGAFMGVGAYVPGLLWNYYGLTPWLGIPAGMVLSVLLALVIGYPCFRLKVVGHYFALVTLALSQVVLLTITAARDITGGSLGMTPKSVGYSWYALQFPDKRYFYFIALAIWLVGLMAWRWIDRGIGREALEAISEDEEAAASVGIDVLYEKLRVTLVSAALTALGGAILGQYLMYLNPETMSGIAVSLQIVFAAIAGGMYSMLGPTVGSLFTLSLTEGLRVWFGVNFIGAANTIYGILLVLFIIFMPRGYWGCSSARGGGREGRRKRRPRACSPHEAKQNAGFYGKSGFRPRIALRSIRATMPNERARVGKAKRAHRPFTDFRRLRRHPVHVSTARRRAYAHPCFYCYVVTVKLSLDISRNIYIYRLIPAGSQARRGCPMHPGASPALHSRFGGDGKRA